MKRANPLRPWAFAWLYDKLVATAQDNGYALALHGSMNRDLDLIAVPWTENASSTQTLIEALAKNAERVKKILKDYSGATEAYDKLTKQIRKLAKIEFNEPAENGFYILTTSELWRDSIRTQKKLFLKAFGSWFNLEDGGNSLNLGMTYGRKESFADFFDIDDDVIEAKLIRLADQDTFPQELLNADVDDDTPDEVEDEEVVE